MKGIIMTPRLLLLLLLLPWPFCSPAPRLSEKDGCLFENSKLRQKLKVLQDLSHLCELQLKDLLGNNYHSGKSKVFSARKTVQDIVLPTTGGNLVVYDQDCAMVFHGGKTQSGYYRIRPRMEREPFLVYCDMEDGGGWTVIQRRSNGKENFFRKWADYKEGFGQFQGKNDEYWLGNDKIYDLLLRGETSLKIDLMDWHGETRYAMYDKFQLKNEMNNYRIWFGTFSGTAGDALSGGSNSQHQWSASLKGMQFSTPDMDNDRYLGGNCAAENRCGWWFNSALFLSIEGFTSISGGKGQTLSCCLGCHAANLNGQYYKKGNYSSASDNGVVWATWRGPWYSLKRTAMKTRLPSFIDAASGDGERIN